MQSLIGRPVVVVYIMEDRRTEKLYSGTIAEMHGTLVLLTNVRSLMLDKPWKDIAVNTTCSQFLQFEFQD